ncbi:F107B protein, partial [Polypterus senegalus]
MRGEKVSCLFNVKGVWVGADGGSAGAPRESAIEKNPAGVELTWQTPGKPVVVFYMVRASVAKKERKPRVLLSSRALFACHNEKYADTSTERTDIPEDLIPSLRSIMAEPDYIDDCDELIKPKKLINPVKTSRNHQDLHRELMMNQKRGLAPQNKPELQKVMEKRKRDLVVKQQKEEEALKKMSDLELELMKRQQKLEQWCILAPTLFNACMDWVMAKVVVSSGFGASVGEERFTHLDFADNAVIFVESIEALIAGSQEPERGV